MEKISKKENFILKAKAKFNNQYSYENVEYINSSSKIKILCNKHREYFEQIPAEHLRGKIGCNLCTRNPKIDTAFFINKAKEIHKDRYDYTETKYINANTKVKIICDKHGIFEVLPNNHYKQNCPKCYNDDRCLTNNEFIEKANKRHDNKYEYSNVEYTSSKDKVNIICNEHGVFNQTPNDHINGKGCPKCGLKYNKLEQEIKDYISELGVLFYSNIKNVIHPFELDIHIPSHNIAIEFNGLYWHSEIYKTNNYHLNKTELCEKKGIQLIQIFEDEWLFKQDIVKSRLLNLLKLNKNKIYARKCVLKEITSKESKEFLNTNHIQGNVNSNIKLGLYYDDELVSIMTFGKLRKSMGYSTKKGSYEMLRFCNKLNTSVIGGADKLLQYFVKLYQPKEIITYADRRWSQGKLYDKLDFEFIHKTKPNYWYINDDKREYRFKYRKDVLVKKGFDINKTEHQIMLERKIYRIYDCGANLYIKKII